VHVPLSIVSPTATSYRSPVSFILMVAVTSSGNAVPARTAEVACHWPSCEGDFGVSATGAAEVAGLGSGDETGLSHPANNIAAKNRTGKNLGIVISGVESGSGRIDSGIGMGDCQIVTGVGNPVARNDGPTGTRMPAGNRDVA